MLKRTISFFVTLILVFAAIPASAEFIDVQGTKYEKAVQLLCDLGIMEGVSSERFEPMEQVKRSDAARYITALSGMQVTCSAQVYTDVLPEHPDYDAIYAATQLGIVSGVGDGLFNPDGFISGEQATKMLVVLAGYKDHAEAAGGYPGGYLAKANSLDILKGVSFGETFTKGELALMMYNTLSVLPAEQSSFGTETGEYDTSTETLLARNLHVYKVTGQVTGNEITNIRGGKLRKGEVAIEGVTYLASSAFAQKIGRKMVAYYKLNEMGIKEIVSFWEADDDANFEALSAKEILPETSPSAIVYQRDTEEKSTTVSISDKTVVLYNGVVVNTVTAQELKPSQGNVYITEEDEGTASVIAIEAYDDFIVADVNPDEGIVFYKDNALEETGLQFMDSNVNYQITDADGALFDLQSVVPGTVLTVMRSRGGSVCTIIASTAKVSGVVTEKTEKAVYIDGKAYEFSASFYGVMPALGENVILALNFEGKIAGNSANVSARKYGYLMSAVYDGKGLSKVAKVKLLTMENEIVVMTAAKNIAVNGITIGNDKLFNFEAELTDVANEAVSKIYQDGTAVEQLIVYEQNGAGEISSILTAEDRTGVFERDRNVFSLQFEASSGMFLAYGLRMFNSKYRMTTDALVFSVGESYDGSNDEQYKVTKGSALQHIGHYPGLKLYDLNEENEAAVMVTKLNLSDDAGTYTADPVLVKSVSMATTEDSDVCEAIRVVGASGKESVYYNPDEVKAVFSSTVISDATKDSVAVDGVLPAEIAISKLRPGDIIKVGAVDGKLTSALVCFRAGSPKELEIAYEGKTRKYPSESNDYYQGLWVYSKVIYAGENGFRFYATNHNGAQRERIHTFGSATVLIYDTQRDTVKVGKPASLAKGDNFFASRYNAAEKLIVIYR